MLDYWSDIGTKKKRNCFTFYLSEPTTCRQLFPVLHKRTDTMKTQHMTSVKSFFPSTRCLFLSTMFQRLTTSTLTKMFSGFASCCFDLRGNSCEFFQQSRRHMKAQLSPSSTLSLCRSVCHPVFLRLLHGPHVSSVSPPF